MESIETAPPHRRKVRPFHVLTLVVSLVLGLSGAAGAKMLAPSATTVPEISLVPMASAVPFASITEVANAGDERLFVAQRVAGAYEIMILHPDESVSPFLTLGIASDNWQAGLLGLAFHPSYTSNGHFFVSYTDEEDDVHLSRFSVTGDPDVADPSSELTLLIIDMPEDNPENFGGDLAFGPDGMLYVAVGDGYVSSPPPPYGNAASQDLSVLPGKILRLNVDDGSPYSVPEDNPFVGVAGAREEIWAYGLRNPWRIGFDSVTGDLWLGDVGQADWEEVNLVPAGSGGGQDFGWPCFEGLEAYAGAPDSVCNPLPASVAPIVAYAHTGNCAITGGFRYRGAAYPVLQGHYLYADWCSGNIWSVTPDGNGDWTDVLLLNVPGLWPVTFGEDHLGEIIVGSSPLGGSGTLYRVVENTPYGYVYLPQIAVSP